MKPYLVQLKIGCLNELRILYFTMSKLEKLIARIKSCPKDLEWHELTTLLGRLGFEEIQGSGSRVRFIHKNINRLIQLHKPHPAKILKPYMIREVLEVLIREKLI